MSLEEFGTKTTDPEEAVIPTGKAYYGHSKGAEPEEPSESKEPSFTQWSIFGPNQYLAGSPTIGTLKPGFYKIPGSYQGQPIFEKQSIKVDDLLIFKDSLSAKIFKEIESFWKLEAKFTEYGYLHRRGYLLYGPQGSGKSAISQQVIKNVVEGGDIVFSCSDKPNLLVEALNIFRQIEPNRRIVCLFEDLDAIIQTWGESAVLGLLDGESQIDKVLNIATTNYPERLDKRIVSRPRRFDRVLKIGMPNEAVRREYFAYKLSLKKAELDKWVKETENLSFASLAELVISVKCLGNKFEETIITLRGMTEAKFSSEEWKEEKDIGFGSTISNN